MFWSGGLISGCDCYCSSCNIILCNISVSLIQKYSLVSLYAEMFSFEEVGVEGFHCVQVFSFERVGIERFQRFSHLRRLE